MTERRLAAIMFTDIVGYTALMGSDEDKAFEVLKKNREIHNRLIEQFNGTLIKEMGDGMLISFNLASDAVRCAIEIQKACKLQVIPLKIGIHEGEMVFEGADVLGDGVNIASRLQEDAQEGCINISGSVYRDIKNKSGIKSELIGEKSFKNVDEPIKVYKIFCDEIPQKSNSPLISEQKTQEKKSIIVLPFVNMSPEPDQEYFSDGLTEEIITDLSHIHDLLVISRNSAMTFKGSGKTTQEIAEKVNVRYVLEGSVRKSGNKLRIIAQLIDAITDTHIFAEKYSGNLDDIFEIQENVSRAIVNTLSLKLNSETKERISKRSTSDFIVLDCWLKGQYELWKWTEEGLNNASILFQNALKIAGESPVVCAGMGYVHYQFVNMGYSLDMDHLKKAEDYARRALKLDPDSPQGHVVLGLCLGSWGGKLKEGIKHFKLALSVSPNDYDAVLWLISYYAHLGKIDEANSYIEMLEKIDPLSPYLIYKGFVHLFVGEFKKAHEILKETIELYPNVPTFIFYYALNLAYMGQIDGACKFFEKAHKKEPKSRFLKEGLFLSLALNGRKDKILSTLVGSDVEIWARRNGAFPYFIAECYGIIGEKEQALDWLEITINNGLVNYPLFNEYDPLLENIRREPRFKKLMKRVKCEWENFDV